MPMIQITVINILTKPSYYIKLYRYTGQEIYAALMFFNVIQQGNVLWRIKSNAYKIFIPSAIATCPWG